MKLHSRRSLTKSANQTHTNILRIDNLENLILINLTRVILDELPSKFMKNLESSNIELNM